MTGQGLLQLVLYIVLLAALVKPLGTYMAAVFQGERTFLSPLIGPVERLIYRLTGVDPVREQPWSVYALSLLVFSAVSVLGLFLLQRVPLC